jgi:hypothetical protein
MRQADIVASLGIHMNLGNPIGVVPLRATTGLCGGAFHSETSSLVTIHANAKVSHRRNFCVRFCTFTNFDFCDFDLFGFSTFAISENREIRFFEFSKTFALYNAMGPRRSWPGMTPASGRRPQAGVASVVLPDEAAMLREHGDNRQPRAIPCPARRRAPLWP